MKVHFDKFKALNEYRKDQVLPSTTSSLLKLATWNTALFAREILKFLRP